MIRISVLVLTVVVGTAFGQPPTSVAGEGDDRSVAVLICRRDFDFEEYRATTGYLIERGWRVVTVSTDTGVATAMTDSVVRPEMSLAEVGPEQYSALVLIGGVGSVLFWNDSLVLSFIRTFAGEKEHVIGAIGLGSITLAKAGLLKGRKATAYNDHRAVKLLQEGGARFASTDVVVDNRIVTAMGSEVGLRFAKALERELRRVRGE